MATPTRLNTISIGPVVMASMFFSVLFGDLEILRIRQRAQGARQIAHPSQVEEAQDEADHPGDHSRQRADASSAWFMVTSPCMRR